MTKLLYVVRGGDEDRETFVERMRFEVAGRLLALKPSRLTLTLTETPPPKLSLFPFVDEPVAAFGVHLEGGDASAYTQALEAVGAALSGYEVEESHPVLPERTWNEGEPIPSPVILNLLHRKPGLDDETYMRRWHGGHTPLSIEIHRLWYYQRNVILSKLTPDSAPSDGVVIEAAADRAHLLNPIHFYGGALRMLPNIVRIATDIVGWLDMKKFEVFYATEYLLKG